MKMYVSILRGINVSGHKLIKMKSLQEMYESLGFAKVQTYIQSGNVVFGVASGEAEQLEKLISGEILKCFGFEVPVLVLAGETMKIIASQNHFLPEKEPDLQKLHVTFLSGVPDVKLIENIVPSEYLPDEFFILGKVIYLYCPNGYGNTRLSNNFFEKKLKVQATTRNWKTVLELVKISE